MKATYEAFTRTDFNTASTPNMGIPADPFDLGLAFILTRSTLFGCGAYG